MDTKRFRDVDIDRSAYRKMLGIRDNQLLVLAVGELSHRKNHQIQIVCGNKYSFSLFGARAAYQIS